MVEKSGGGADGFLGRWARRKNDALQGRPLDEPVEPAAKAPLNSSPPVARALPVATGASATEPSPAEPDAAPVRELSLDDAILLTKDSDFKPFMASNVGPEVRNAAMKKLFADPHFNVMDGLDIYIDDYSISEPIPESMLRQMASAKFLKLFDDEEEEKPGDKSPDNQAVTDTASVETEKIAADSAAAYSEALPNSVSKAAAAFSLPTDSSQAGLLTDSGVSQKAHDHTDLRLQPDDAASGPEAGRRT